MEGSRSPVPPATPSPGAGGNLGLAANLGGAFASSEGCTGNHLDVPRGGDNPNLLSPEILNQRRGSRRPSILPVPDMFTSSALNISTDTVDDEADESEDEVDDDVPWRSPSEKIA